MRWRIRAALFPALVATAGALTSIGAPAQTAARPGDASFGLPPLERVDTSTVSQRELGRKLFFDRRLSSNGTMSCGMCHVPEEGFTSNASQLALGLEGRSLARNAPGLVNVAWQRTLFHDGRRSTLEQLVWEPLLHPHEMGNASTEQVLSRLRGLDDYRRRFAHAFPGRGLARGTVGEALAAYQRTLVAADAPFDRWRYGTERGALDARVGARALDGRANVDTLVAHANVAALDLRARAGFALFTGKARCAACHLVGERDATFTDGAFHVTGAGLTQPATYDVPLAPGVSTVMPREALAVFDEHTPVDLGRFAVTKRAADRHAFKTPSLRNVSRTAPYMHDGSLPTLDAAIDFYDRGGGAITNKSPLLAPLNLTRDEKAALVAFLRALDSPHVAGLVEAARRR